MNQKFQTMKSLKLSPFVPYDPNAEVFVKKEGHQLLDPADVTWEPFEYAGWREESLSWHTGCYIHSGLNPTSCCMVSGKDALKFFESICVNTFKNFTAGSGKHAIACNEEGKILAHGLLLRHGEELFTVTGLFPYLEYAVRKSGMEITFKNLIGQIFIYQMGGPKSLQILEAAAGESLRDIRFIRFRKSSIAGKEVTIVRMGMCGTLAYEVHGKTEDAIPVYEAILEAGKAFGLQKLGRHAYRNVHTEGGFPNINVNFPCAYDEGYVRFLQERNIRPAGAACLTGSLGSDPAFRYYSPVELGWEKMICFDHEFPGRAALEKEKAAPRRRIVILKWSVDDILEVKRSQYLEGEPYMPMEDCEDYNYSIGAYDLHADRVLKDGKMIGSSTGRMFSPFNREMISLGVIDCEYCAEGTEISVLWGDEGRKQKEIRAVVSSYPYIKEGRNENVDVGLLD